MEVEAGPTALRRIDETHQRLKNKSPRKIWHTQANFHCVIVAKDRLGLVLLEVSGRVGGKKHMKVPVSAIWVVNSTGTFSAAFVSHAHHLCPVLTCVD